jgi:hypothetical protein
VAFFYFDFRSKGVEPTSLLRALIKQLYLKSPKPAKVSDYLVNLFSDKENGQGSLSPEELKSTLKSIIGAFKNVYIVFDALDECPDRHQFLGLIKEIQGWNLDTLHLLATSRDEQDIEKTLRGLVSHQISMDESLVDSDIRVYVSRALKDDEKLSKYSAEKKETIETTLIDGAHGMYVIFSPLRRSLSTGLPGFNGLFVSWMHYESAGPPTSSRWRSPIYHRLYMKPTTGFSYTSTSAIEGVL